MVLGTIAFIIFGLKRREKDHGAAVPARCTKRSATTSPSEGAPLSACSAPSVSFADMCTDTEETGKAIVTVRGPEALHTPGTECNHSVFRSTERSSVGGQ